MSDRGDWTMTIGFVVVVVLVLAAILADFLIQQGRAEHACKQEHGVVLKQPGLHWACIEKGQH